MYFLVYVGIETGISGWLVSFMVRYRNATPYIASMASFGFWAGMTAERFTLGVITDKMGVGGANIIYYLINIALQMVFAFVPVPIASIFFMTLIGFFMGPMFASGVVILTQLLPRKVNIAAVSFVASAGQVGAALLPFCTGVFIRGLGVGILRVVVVILPVLALLVWIQVLRQWPSVPSHSSHEYSDVQGDVDSLH